MPLPDIHTSVPFRLFAVCVLIVILAVPTALVWAIVEMRSNYEEVVTDEITSTWGGTNDIVGPFMRFDLRDESSSVDGNEYNDSHTRSYFITPKTFESDSTSEHQFRYIGIFVRPVYIASFNLKGHFENDLPSFAAHFGLDSKRIESCSLMIQINQSQQIRDLKGTFNNHELSFKPAALPQGGIGDSIQAALSQEECTTGSFDLTLTVRGSHSLAITPVGDTSTLKHRSTWPHPKFDGRQIPDSHDITDDGFSAVWSSNALARGFASELDEEHFSSMSDSGAGITLTEPVSLYRMVTRAVKYGFLVIGLTLLSIFCLEMISKVNIHPVQYAIVGSGLTIFYLLLLSFAEHIGFTLAYVIASASLTILILGYAWFSTKQTKFCAHITLLLAIVFGALYVCLSSTDYALLIGSLLLVVLLAGMMYATRNMAASNVEQIEGT